MRPSRSVIISVLLFISANIVPSTCTDWDAQFDPNITLIVIDEIEEVHLILSNLSAETSDTVNRNFVIKNGNENVAVVDNPDGIVFRDVAGQSGMWETHFRVKGTARLRVQRNGNGMALEQSNELLEVIVSRPERLIDTLFAVIVVLLLSILFINFGAAIDIKSMKQIFRKPIGPAIGTFCQLVLVPLIAYGLGLALFPNDPGLALGLFLTGVSPAGGASNIWTLLCGGNINLSISMTTISTLACFGTIPLWLFLLGRTIVFIQFLC